MWKESNGGNTLYFQATAGYSLAVCVQIPPVCHPRFSASLLLDLAAKKELYFPTAGATYFVYEMNFEVIKHDVNMMSH